VEINITRPVLLIYSARVLCVDQAKVIDGLKRMEMRNKIDNTRCDILDRRVEKMNMLCEEKEEKKNSFVYFQEKIKGKRKERIII